VYLSIMLLDNHGREINYMRLAVTDRCNLRCFYCMPEEGIQYLPKKELLTFEEMLRVTKIFADQGISKIRITGGEPFLRKDLMQFLENIAALDQIKDIHITTNGTLLIDKIPKLKALGINSINLSLDSLDKQRFHEITRRDDLDTVIASMHALIAANIKVKINMVVMDGRNTEDIIPMLELAKDFPVDVRFIEEMPFNGTKGQGNPTFWSHKKILEHIQTKYPTTIKLQDPAYSTSMNYQIPDFKGTFGIIAAFSRTFCGTCNRIRLTPQGTLKTCLYDNGIFNIRDLIRAGATDEDLVIALQEALNHRAKDGHEAEQNRNKNFPVSESMATIGG